MTSDAHMFSNMTQVTSDFVDIGNGAHLPVSHFGNTKRGLQLC